MRKKSVLYFVFCLTILWCGAKSQTNLDSYEETIPDSNELNVDLEKDYLFPAYFQRAGEPETETGEECDPGTKSTCETGGKRKCVKENGVDTCKCDADLVQNGIDGDKFPVCKEKCAPSDKTDKCENGDNRICVLEKSDGDGEENCVCKVGFKEISKDDEENPVCEIKECNADQQKSCTEKKYTKCQISVTDESVVCSLCEKGYEEDTAEKTCKIKECNADQQKSCTEKKYTKCQISATDESVVCSLCEKGYQEDTAEKTCKKRECNADEEKSCTDKKYTKCQISATDESVVCSLCEKGYEEDTAKKTCKKRECNADEEKSCTEKKYTKCQISATDESVVCSLCEKGFEEDTAKKTCKRTECNADEEKSCTDKKYTKCQISATDESVVCSLCEKGYEEDTAKKTCKKLHVCTSNEHSCPTDTTRCVPKGDDYYCECLDGFVLEEGKMEENKKACQNKTKCNEKKGVCPVSTTCKLTDENEDGYYCECLPGYKLPVNVTEKQNKDSCISPCESHNCKNGATCKVDPKNKKEGYSCSCADFYGGTFCEKAACKDSICGSGKCNKDKNGCVCPPSHSGTKCETIIWCERNICGDSSECKYDSKKDTGFCECKEKTNYFNYNDKKCKAIPACVLTPCPAYEECNTETGDCDCKSGYERKEKKCVKKDVCDPETCSEFSGSTCSEINGMAVCTCNSTQYYADNTCKDATCFLKRLRKNCKEDCPSGLIRKDNGECGLEEGSCTKKCGDYGWCDKEGETEICVCIEEVAELNENGDRCILKKDVCPEDIELQKSSNLTCDCTYRFKKASNGITCLRRVCADKDVQDECNKYNAVCDDNWGSRYGYICECRPGYDLDENGVCTDMCSSLEGKLACFPKKCFLGVDGKRECRDPPGTKPLKNSAFLLHNVPVKSAKYMSGSKLDIVSLSTQIIKAMKQTFQNLDFAHLYTYRQLKDTVMCTVWLEFKSDAVFDYRRLGLQAVQLKQSDILYLPPNLFLEKSAVSKVNETVVELCSGLDDDPFCGGATCDKSKCKCREGFKIVESSIRKVNFNLIFTCVDINECKENSQSCPPSTECVNTEGDFYCRCLAKYKTKDNVDEKLNKADCVDLCNKPNPCANGAECKVDSKTSSVYCKCPAGYYGATCEENDLNLAGAKKKTVVVGAILGSILGILVILMVLYIYRQKKKSSYDEDFTPSPPQRQENAEMMERRPVRGVTNRGYQ